jgi:hypothetical protein
MRVMDTKQPFFSATCSCGCDGVSGEHFHPGSPGISLISASRDEISSETSINGLFLRNKFPSPKETSMV